MKNLLILLFFACFCNSLFCQYDQKTKAGDSINITPPRHFNNTPLKTTNLYAGYKIGGKDKHTNHTLDIGITRNKIVRGQHYASSGYYAATYNLFRRGRLTVYHTFIHVGCMTVHETFSHSNNTVNWNFISSSHL